MEVILRKEIEPQLEIAESRYQEILDSIMAYTEYCDEEGDEDFVEYKKLEEKLHLQTGKEMSQFNLWEWWEEEGAEVLAFRIALPNPIKVNEITKEELSEIVRRAKTFDKDVDENSFKEQFKYHLHDYYYDFLKLNFKSYQQDLFHRQKDKSGNYFEYSVDEIVEKLLDKKYFRK